MLPRAIPLVLVLVLAACHTAPELASRSASTPLLGTWEYQMPPEKGGVAQLRFDPDGSLVRTSYFIEQAFETKERWRLVEDRDGWVTIAVPAARELAKSFKNETREEQRRFVFETNDLMREEGGWYDGVTYARVTATK